MFEQSSCQDNARTGCHRNALESNQNKSIQANQFHFPTKHKHNMLHQGIILREGHVTRTIYNLVINKKTTSR